jgi:hypothetical protein
MAVVQEHNTPSYNGLQQEHWRNACGRKNHQQQTTNGLNRKCGENVVIRENKTVTSPCSKTRLTPPSPAGEGD